VPHPRCRPFYTGDRAGVPDLDTTAPAASPIISAMPAGDEVIS
jgi:hypothetical protein